MTNKKEKYEAILYTLGAVPISKLDKEVQVNKRADGKATYFKNDLVEVNGWLSPRWVKKGGLLTDVVTKEKDIPKELQKYCEYASLLDVDEYIKTKDPLQYAIMAFTLDNLLMDRIEIENLDDIIRVYKAGIGLEERALPLLKDHLNSDQAMDLYSESKDARLLDVLPSPQPEDKKYIQFLLDIAERESDKGWCALYLLYKMDKSAYREKFRDFITRKVHETSSLQDRMGMYSALAEIGDDKSREALATSLLEDPVTEGREAILSAALERKVCSRELVDSVEKILKGLGEKHRSFSTGRMADQWNYYLREYLMWVKDNESCENKTRKGAKDTLELIRG